MAGASGSKAAILNVLADVSPSGQSRSSALTVPLDWFQWLPALSVRLFRQAQARQPEGLGTGRWGDEARARVVGSIEAPMVNLDRGLGERLAAIDAIRPGEQHSLRVGWLFVAGRRPLADGRMQRVLHPLVSVPVRVTIPPLLGHAVVQPAGDVELSDCR